MIFEVRKDDVLLLGDMKTAWFHHRLVVAVLFFCLFVSSINHKRPINFFVMQDAEEEPDRVGKRGIINKTIILSVFFTIFQT